MKILCINKVNVNFTSYEIVLVDNILVKSCVNYATQAVWQSSVHRWRNVNVKLTMNT